MAAEPPELAPRGSRRELAPKPLLEAGLDSPGRAR
jgi:hypothetical protein